ncbi:cupin domain-containing protein [Stappia sp.]|uniref:cupin domain-containing protein n=1 Tax=Stappia sp. TaxID=1870903 RepID=UPI0032D99E97
MRNTSSPPAGDTGHGHAPDPGIDGDAIEVGHRLRAAREAAGLSQRALARRAGVTNSTISLIESGKTNPSVGALKRVLDGIPIGLSEFFAFQPQTERQVFFAAEELKQIGKGRLSLRQVGNDLFGRTLQILHETYAPGADTGRVMYEHDGEEGGIVISGRIEITVGSERKILGPGDAYLFDSRRPHRFRAVGPDPCVLISACTPPSF